MERKILFFDIDDTLLQGDGTVPPSAVRALNRAHELGHLLFVNTGRCRCILPPAVTRLPFTGYVCGCGTYIEAEGKVLYHRLTPHGKCVEMVNAMEGFHMYAVYEQAERVSFAPWGEHTERQQGFKDYFRLNGIPTHHSTEDADFTFDKFFSWFGPEADFLSFQAYLKPDFSLIRRGEFACEIVPHDCSKATGMALLLNHYGISVEHCYAFGDSQNDLAMLRFTPNSVAMEKNDGLSELVNFVTKDISHGGLAHAMEHYGLV